MRCSTARARSRARILVAFAAAASSGAFLAGCAGRARTAERTAENVDRDGEAAACPRDAVQAPSGRCACEDGTMEAMGACVDPSLADAFCAPAARMTADGCAFRRCGEGEIVDVATGECASRALLPADPACGEGTSAASAASRPFCLPNEAACPRATVWADGGASRTACVRGPRCPPGSLSDGAACRPIVFSRDGRARDPRVRRFTVDVGAWTARALGIDGGRGSPELCRPLAMRPDLFVAEGSQTAVPLDIDVAIFIPDEDVTQVHASIAARAPQPLSAQAEDAVRAAVGTLVELLRGLGGDAMAAFASARVRCTIGTARR